MACGVLDRYGETVAMRRDLYAQPIVRAHSARYGCSMNPLTAETMWTIPRVGAPVTSSGWIVAPVTTWESDHNTSITQLWRCKLDGSELRQLTNGVSATRPSLSPDGSTLALVRSVDGEPRLHLMAMDGGEPFLVDGIEHSVIGAKWSPDGSRLFVVANVAGDDTDGAGVHISDRGLYRYWDRWLTDGSRPHIFEFDTKGSMVRDLTPSQDKWMPWDNTDDPLDDVAVSSTSVVYCATRPSTDDGELRFSVYSIDLETGLESEVTPWLDGHAHRPRFGAGDRLTVGIQLAPHHYADPIRLVEIDGAGYAELDLGDWDRSPNAWEWHRDGSLILTAEDRGSIRLFRWSEGRPEPLTATGSVGGLATDGDTIAVFYHSLTSPPEIGVVGVDGLAILTRFAGSAMEDLDMPVVDEIEVIGSESEAIQVFVLGACDEPRPLVHMIHGGPHGIFGDQWHWRWNAAVFAGAEFVVALTNFTGSTSFGEEFTEAIHGAWGDRPATDIEAVTDHLIEVGIADGDRLAITGGSYGGYLVSWLITQTDRYRCAVAHAAVTDLPTMYGSDLTMGLDLAFGEHAWRDTERVQRWSPLSHATSISTPTLVIHGDRDYRVPVGQGLALYGMLQSKGVPTRLVHFDDEGHFVLDRGRSIIWYREVTDWLNRWLS